jgi:hypothetical protein
MSSKPHHNEPFPQMQERDLNDAQWNEVVSKRLPRNLEAKAIELKAWRRQRELRCVSDLLRALLVYVCCGYSWRELGIWAVLKGLGALSERAWRKRLDRSQAWIHWLLGEVLGVQQRPSWLPEGAGRVLLIDATRLKTLGGTGDDVRLHQSYDLRAGRMEQVLLSDQHTAEGLAHFTFQAGDTVMTDAGYPVASSVELTQQQRCRLLQRTTASHLHVEEETGQTISLKQRIKHVPANCLKELRAWVRLPESGQRAEVRVLCYRLPKEQAKLARERKAAKLRKKYGAHYNAELVWWAGWVILVSTADRAVWSGKDLVRLYRARWQIELFFKRLKQCLQLHQVRLKDWQRVSCVVQLCLISWWLQEQEAQWLRELLLGLLEPLGEDIAELADREEEQDEQHWVLSSWTLTHWCSEQVRTMLRGAWSRQRIEHCLPLLWRYVCSRKRPRGHQQTDQCAWLLSREVQRASRLRA